MKCIYPVSMIYKTGEVINEQALFAQKPLQIGLMETNVMEIHGKASIILDFGKELAGGARILTYKTNKNTPVRLRFGESVAETCAELGEKNATNDHSVRDLTVNLQSYSDMRFGQSGFRFLRIDTINENTTITFKSIVACTEIDEREEVGTFVCDDENVNEIWKTASYTLRLCLQNGYFWDGIKRDRLVWIGDLYPEMRTAHCLFGDVPETFASLKFACDETPIGKWMANMPAYSLWWLIILSDEYKVCGDKEKYACFIPYIKDLLVQVAKHVGEDGVTQYPSNFIDWASCPMVGDPAWRVEENLAGMSYITRLAMQKTTEFLETYGEDTSICQEVVHRLDKRSWNVNVYKQISAMGVWAGDMSKTNEQTLLKGGAKGLSTFMSYPILSGVAKFGHYETALSMMKEYYTGMLSVGATTFWEDFDLDWLQGAGRIDEMPKAGEKDIHGDYGAWCYKGFRHSFCHGWSAGVIPYLVETVAGVRFVGVGQKQLVIAPRLSGLKHVKVTCPTMLGVLTVEHTLQEDGSVKTTVDAPCGMQVEVK